MKVNTLQILWHDKKPVFSVDFSAEGDLATCGADKEIRLWKVVDKPVVPANNNNNNNNKGEGQQQGGEAPSSKEETAAGVEYLCSLSHHQKTVNVVRFSPDGSAIVSAGDSGEVVVWRKNTKAEQRQERTPAKAEAEATAGKERADAALASPSALGSAAEPSSPWAQSSAPWKPSGVLRGQTDDVQDVAWSPDSSAVVTGSVENVAFLWDAGKHKSITVLDGHHHYIQGVAWDPLGEFVVTQSGDRSCRVYAPKAKPKRKRKDAQPPKPTTCAARMQSCGVTLQSILSKLQTTTKEEVDGGEVGEAPPAGTTAPEAQGPGEAENPVARDDDDGEAQQQKKQRVDQHQSHFLFHDETMPSFFRRLSFSPDGSFLACPAGLYKKAVSNNKPGNCVHIFKRGQWSKPMATLPALSKAVVAVKFCPVVFEKTEAQQEQQQGKGKWDFDLPHKIYFAVLTLDSVIIYETDSMKPTALISGLHCASLTDLAWSPDGRRIAVSSHDGYCSLISFSEGELGKALLPAKVSMMVPQAQQAKEEASSLDPPATPAPAYTKGAGPLESQNQTPQPTAQAQAVELVRNPTTNATVKRIAPMQIR
uniref:CAF1B/HIR1 beta-propeller domain-containing protein n=1 Tax=Chloropicon primus TaxID=1764295 RepID=A0A7S2X1S9_9CHLO